MIQRITATFLVVVMIVLSAVAAGVLLTIFSEPQHDGAVSRSTDNTSLAPSFMREVKLADQFAQKSAQPVSVFVFGDIMLGRHVESGVTHNDLSGLFKNIIGDTPPLTGGDVTALVRLSDYDVVIVNLEGPVVQTRAPKFKEIQFLGRKIQLIEAWKKCSKI